MREFRSSATAQTDEAATLEMRALDAAELDQVSGNGIIGAIVGGVIGGVSVYKACPENGGLLRAGMAAMGAVEGIIIGGCLSPI
jgi:hypothetical protein